MSFKMAAMEGDIFERHLKANFLHSTHFAVSCVCSCDSWVTQTLQQWAKKHSSCVCTAWVFLEQSYHDSSSKIWDTLVFCYLFASDSLSLPIQIFVFNKKFSKRPMWFHLILRGLFCLLVALSMRRYVVYKSGSSWLYHFSLLDHIGLIKYFKW